MGILPGIHPWVYSRRVTPVGLFPKSYTRGFLSLLYTRGFLSLLYTPWVTSVSVTPVGLSACYTCGSLRLLHLWLFLPAHCWVFLPAHCWLFLPAHCWVSLLHTVGLVPPAHLGCSFLPTRVILFLLFRVDNSCCSGLTTLAEHAGNRRE